MSQYLSVDKALEMVGRHPLAYGVHGAAIDKAMRKLKKQGLLELEYDGRGELVWRLPKDEREALG